MAEKPGFRLEFVALDETTGGRGGPRWWVGVGVAGNTVLLFYHNTGEGARVEKHLDSGILCLRVAPW